MAKKAAPKKKAEKKDEYSIEDLQKLAEDINGSELFEDQIDLEEVEDLEEAIDLIKEVIVEDDVCQIYTTDSLNKTSFATLEMIGCAATVPDEEEEEAATEEETEENAPAEEEEEEKPKKKGTKKETPPPAKKGKAAPKKKVEKENSRRGNAEALAKARNAKKNFWGHVIGSQADKIDIAVKKMMETSTAISTSDVCKKTSLATARVRSHLKHLIDKKDLEITIVE